MKISIPTNSIIGKYNGGSPIFPEAYFTIDEWLKKRYIQAQDPPVDNGNSLFEDGISSFIPNRESLLDIFQGDGITLENPFVWECDRAIFDLTMPTTIVPARIPTGGEDSFPNIYKYTEVGTSVKTVGEWVDSLCEIWEKPAESKVQIFTNPINNDFIAFHLVRAFALEFTVANHPELTNDTDYITTTVAATRRGIGTWNKLQP